jgi:hypothetical protein
MHDLKIFAHASAYVTRYVTLRARAKKVVRSQRPEFSKKRSIFL